MGVRSHRLPVIYKRESKCVRKAQQISAEANLTWLKVWDEAPALAADPPNPPPNCGAAKAAAIRAKRTMNNFMVKIWFHWTKYKMKLSFQRTHMQILYSSRSSKKAERLERVLVAILAQFLSVWFAITTRNEIFLSSEVRKNLISVVCLSWCEPSRKMNANRKLKVVFPLKSSIIADTANHLFLIYVGFRANEPVYRWSRWTFYCDSRKRLAELINVGSQNTSRSVCVRGKSNRGRGQWFVDDKIAPKIPSGCWLRFHFVASYKGTYKPSKTDQNAIEPGRKSSLNYEFLFPHWISSGCAKKRDKMRDETNALRTLTHSLDVASHRRVFMIQLIHK